MTKERRRQLQFAIVAMIPAIRFGMKLATRYPTVPGVDDLAAALEACFANGAPDMDIVEDKELEEVITAFAQEFREKLDRVMAKPRTAKQEAAAAQDLVEKAKKLAKVSN